MTVFLVTENDCPAQFSPSDFEHSENILQDFFIIFTGSEPSDLFVHDCLHKNVDMLMEEELLNSNLMELKLSTMPVHSIFV